MTRAKDFKIIKKSVSEHPLAGKHRVKAYWNFFSWQFSQLLFPGTRKKRFVHDTYLLVKRGMTGATGNLYLGLHEFAEMGFLLHFLQPGDCFYDTGANAGSYTVLAAGVRKATVFAFEPIPATFRILENNIAVNKLQKTVTAFMAAAGSEAGEISFTDNLDTVNHALSEAEKLSGDHAVTVPVITLDSIAEQYEYPVLIKIDVEGFETPVIRGMKKILSDNTLTAVIIELNGSGGRYDFDESLIHRDLLDAGFLPYGYDPFQRKLVQLDTYTNNNTIYIRNRAEAERRLSLSPAVHVFNEHF